MNIIILISTPDSRGLVHKISSNLLDFNIEKNDEFVDRESGQFFMRTEISIDSAESQNLGENHAQIAESALDSANAIKNKIYHRLRAILPKNSFLKVTLKRKKSLIIFATKESHCLGDLLIKNYNNELDIEIKAVISNHRDLGDLVGKFGVPYFYISHDEKNYEDKMLQICQDFAPDFIVLAKYMRILRPKFIAHYENRIINIHHSFLPAFIGANPYKQAYNRGVKIIGATAHFVTSELDSGPIICQDILQVNHTLLWRDMQKAGKNIERIVLARAVELAIDERIFIHNNKTIIF